MVKNWLDVRKILKNGQKKWANGQNSEKKWPVKLGKNGQKTAILGLFRPFSDVFEAFLGVFEHILRFVAKNPLLFLI